MFILMTIEPLFADWSSGDLELANDPLSNDRPAWGALELLLQGQEGTQGTTDWWAAPWGLE